MKILHQRHPHNLRLLGMAWQHSRWARTINTFNTQQNPDYRKGLGFDKVELDDAKRKKGWNPVSDYASPATFGHSGFTGIGVWTDPNYDICYVFLSNRTFPSSENKKLLKGGYRTKIMDVIYESIWTYEGTLEANKVSR